MKIKKVDDKPMVIHTKKKAKIHMHEPKKAKIKGSNIYTVQRGPKIASAKINDTGKKKSYRKSTIHQAEKKEKEPSKFKRNIRESNTSIKTKNTNLHIAGRTGALAAGAVTEQVEGGQEVSQAAYLAYEASRPVTGTASRGASLFRKKAAAEAKRRIKKVETGKKLAKKMGKKAASDTAKKVAGDTTKTAAKETAKNTAKETAKTTTKAATTAAGTAVAPGAGTAVGMAAGYATGVSIEAKDVKAANRSRKIKFFLDKMKEQENQTDSVVKLVKDLIVKKAVLWIKAAAPIIGLVLLLLVLLVVIVAVPVIAVIAILYNSPFALFLPPLESGDTVQTVTSAYVSEFNRDVNTKVNEHTGYDFGELVYVDYEGMDENPSNYYDIMAVYMVKYGVGDTATIMNDISKGWLQTVVNDMCSYTTSSGKKKVLIGSTDKCGTGVNVQTHLVAMHHVDCPWKPSSIEQREGRGIRQGNKNDEVAIYRYVTKQTFDAYNWSLVENKQRFISQVMTSKAVSRSCEDIDEATLSYAEIKAVATGNPLIREKMEVDNDVQRLKLLKASYDNQRYGLQDNFMIKYPKLIKTATEKLANVREDIKARDKELIDNPDFAITIGNATYTERVDGGTVMLEAISKCKTGETTPVGKFHGFELLVEKNFLSINYMVLRGKTEYKAELSTSPVGSMVKLENLFNGLHENVDFLEKKIEQYQNDLEASKAEYDKPFAYSAELEEKLARQYELNAQLDLENAKAMDADLGGPDEEKSEDRIENAGIVAEDKGIYMPDRNRKR